MRKTRTVSFVLGVLLVPLLGLTAGCSSKAASSMSDREKQDFKGGPMPPEARAKMAERMRAINKPSPAAPNK